LTFPEAISGELEVQPDSSSKGRWFLDEKSVESGRYG